MRDIRTSIFNTEIKELQNCILKDDIVRTIELALLLNGIVHCSNISKMEGKTLEDILWEYPEKDDFRRINEKNRYSVSWHLWHSARIEDICSHELIEGNEQIYVKKNYEKKLNLRTKATGNEFTDLEMWDFNERIDIQELRKYRNDVGIESRKIIKSLDVEGIKRKVNKNDIDRISEEGYVGIGSEWLLEFWGKKKISGIITMPLTRHILVHLNDCKKILKIKG